MRNERSRILRIVLALLLAPLATPAVLFFLEGVVSGYTDTPGHMEKLIQLAFAFLVFSYVVTLALGFPIVIGLAWLKRLYGLHTVGVSIVAGAAAALPYAVGQRDISLVVLSTGVIAALLNSGLFCLIAGIRWRRPKDLMETSEVFSRANGE